MRTLPAMPSKFGYAATCLSLVLAACEVAGGTPPSPEDGSAPAPDLAAPAVGARITGTVIDLDRHGLPGVRIQLCGPSCREVTTDSSGIFELPSVGAASYGLHAELPGVPAIDYGKVVVPIYYLDPKVTPVRTVPPIVLPRLAAPTPLAAGKQTVAIDSALSLTLDADALTFPAGGGAPQLAGLRIPAGLYPDFCLPGDDGRIVAEWALGPFGTTSSTPISVHIADSLGLQPGSTVVLSSIDPELGRPERQGLGKVSADGKSIDSLATVELRRLTWLVVSLPGGGP